MGERLSGAARAKVNLVLEVTGKRPDGYHEIDTVLQEIELADTVTVSFGSRSGVAVSGPFAEGTPADETNLAWRAAEELARRSGHSTDGLAIAIDKHIPPAGGLGGGASDAAATLRLLESTWPEATGAMVREAANAVGSDEAFFLVGGTARARGRGERVEPLPDLSRHGVVLFMPRLTLERKTARMFAALDNAGFDDGAVAEHFVRKMPQTVGAADVFNSFERVAFEMFPGLAELWRKLEDATKMPVRLAGAGPTLFWIGPEREAERVARAAAGFDCSTIMTATAARR